jgi:Flp pilus assembly protein protease CpaA
MFREAIIKLGGATLLLLGIALLAIGFMIANKQMQATGFIGGVIALALLYFNHAVENRKQLETEPDEKVPLAKH